MFPIMVYRQYDVLPATSAGLALAIIVVNTDSLGNRYHQQFIVSPKATVADVSPIRR